MHTNSIKKYQRSDLLDPLMTLPLPRIRSKETQIADLIKIQEEVAKHAMEEADEEQGGRGSAGGAAAGMPQAQGGSADPGVFL
jgi:hypothetical protein